MSNSLRLLCVSISTNFEHFIENPDSTTVWEGDDGRKPVLEGGEETTIQFH